MELAVILVVLVLSYIYFRRIDSLIYVICVIDILFRIITKLEVLLNIDKYSYYVNKYIPGSLSYLIDKYTKGQINDILTWIYMGLYLIFIVLIIKSLFNKKKR